MNDHKKRRRYASRRKHLFVIKHARSTARYSNTSDCPQGLNFHSIRTRQQQYDPLLAVRADSGVV